MELKARGSKIFDEADVCETASELLTSLFHILSYSFQLSRWWRLSILSNGIFELCICHSSHVPHRCCSSIGLHRSHSQMEILNIGDFEQCHS